MTIHVDPSRDAPPSRQIVEAVLDALAAGTWTAGDRLPSVRGLAGEALVNPNTVGKAYRELEALGVVAGRNGAGVFVTPAGPDVARTQRREATLESLERAVAAALAAGHDPLDLARHLDRALAAAPGAAQPARRAS